MWLIVPAAEMLSKQPLRGLFADRYNRTVIHLTGVPMTDERLISGQRRRDDRDNIALRPRLLKDIVGQDSVRDNLDILIQAARNRTEPVDHVLFYGPPGLGKTSFAHVIANEMGVNIRVTAGPSIERAGDLAAILTHLKQNDILFIDEVHRLGRAVEEVLYPAMEDFVLDIVIGKGPAAKNVRLNLPRFTVIGATTRLALLAAPLRDRFGAQFRLDFYNQEALEFILRRAAEMLKVDIRPEGTGEIARRARGTPRIALRLLRRVRDYAQVKTDGIITGVVAGEALALLNIDFLGLDDIDRRILNLIIDKYGGGPVGLDTIAAAISEDTATIMDVCEPYLLQLGFLARTPRGRMATPAAYEHLGMAPPDRGGQGLLF
jgi:holliday junction DNA helicase RuvB